MKAEKFPLTVTESGVSAKIYRGKQTRNGTIYNGFIVAYSLLGKRKQVWRSELGDAKTHAREVCGRIANGESEVLQLTNHDRLTYLRAVEAVSALRIPIDVLCREYAEAAAILKGRASIVEAARDWVKRNAVELPRITLAKAVEECLEQARIDRKSSERVKRLSSLERLANDLQVEVHTITPDVISRWLAALPFAERTRANYRDVVGFFCRFCVRRGYLAKGTDWLEGVQKYRKRKIGVISIFEPAEMTKFLRHAEQHAKDMVPFLAIGAFAGLRTSEIERLNWRQVDLEDGYIEVLPIDGTKSEERRRLVPIKPNLKAWLSRYQKESGPVFQYENSAKQIEKLEAGAACAWRHNAMRHTCISCRIAESGDVARVADESGNSPTVIRSAYLRRLKPTQAAEWFNIMPEVQP